MAIETRLNCDACGDEITIRENCYCEICLEKTRDDSFQQGFDEARKEFEK